METLVLFTAWCVGIGVVFTILALVSDFLTPTSKDE